MILALALLASGSAFANDSIRNYVAKNPSKVAARSYEFQKRIEELIGGRRFSKHVISGYSGADYADKDLFQARFTKLANEARSQTKERLGKDAVTVIAMGGTVDGVGAGYKMIHDMKLTDVIVVGMVADQAVDYHLDGIKNGYDVLAPEQEMLYVVPTYRDLEGNRSWELKETSRGESQTIQFLVGGYLAPAYSVLHLIEGGEIAFKEGLEYLVEARRLAIRDLANKPALELRLYAGHREGKLKKLKGFKAATQMLLAMSLTSKLRPENIKVTAIVENDETIFTEAKAALKSHPELLFDPNASARAEARAAMPTVEIELRRTAFLTALSKTSTHAIQQLTEGQRRVQDQISLIRSWTNNLSHRINDSPEGLAGAGRAVNRNLKLASEIESLKMEMAKSIACQGPLLK